MSNNWKRNRNDNWRHPHNRDENWKPTHSDGTWKRPHNKEESHKRPHNKNENWKRPYDANTKLRFEKPFSNVPRHTLNFYRRPFPSRRRGMIAVRYPNMGFRQHAPTTCLPDRPAPQIISSGLKNSTSNLPTGICAPFVKQLPLLPMPISNSDNKNNEYISSVTNINKEQVGTEFHKQNSESNDLWVESLAPGGKIYYYNARTRESTWRKPINVRIIELNEIQKLTDIEKPDKMRQENSNQSMQQQPINESNSNDFYPRKIALPPPRIMFPPNVFTPPPNFHQSTAVNIQSNVANYNIRFVMPPPVLPIPIVPVVSNNIMNAFSVSQTLLPTNNIIEYNSNLPQNLLPSNNIVEHNSNLRQNLLPGNNVVECNSNFFQNQLPINNIGEYSSNLPQNLLLSNNNVQHNSNVFQNQLLTNNIVEYNSNLPQNLLPSNNIVEHNSNVLQNLLPTNNIVEYNSNLPQNLLQSNNVVECNSNVLQDVLPRYEFDCSTYSDQIMLSNNEIVDCHENTMQNSLSSEEMLHHNETAAQNLIPISKVIDYSSTDSDEKDVKISTNENKEVTCIKFENNEPSIDTSLSYIPLFSSNSVDIGTIKNVGEKIEQHAGEKFVDLKSKCANQITKSKDVIMTETKDKSSIEVLRDDKPVDKSRPVSSTAVPRSVWCVVWTGDEKVFFFDSERKVSVWERPAELLGRNDVDKMLKKSPLSLNLKPLIKEARKNTSSDHLDVIKKQKKDYEKGEYFESKKTVENTNVESIVVDENNSEVEQESELEPYSHEHKIEKFCEMLSDNKVSISSTSEKEVHKTVFDTRLPVDERKQIFNNYIEGKSLEGIDSRQKEQLVKDEFLSMLMEAGVTSESQFCNIAHRCSEDTRFKSIEELDLKENMFNQYVLELKQKDEEREKLENKLKSDFIELLSEKSCFDKEWPDVKNILSEDERYKSIQNDSLKEDLFKEYVHEKRLNVSLTIKQENADDGAKDREKNVERDLTVHRKNQEERQKYIIAVSNFKSMLEDLIEDSVISWKSARTVLKADQRWNYSEHLGATKCEKLFHEHTDAKKRDQFRRLLDELPDVTVKTSWLDIRKDVLKDPRCARLSSCERKCEKEFKEYLNSKQARAKFEFYQLLKETKLITRKSKPLLKNSDHLKDIEKTLSEDKRYLNLDFMRNERKKMILSYIEKLHAKASPSQPKTNDPLKLMKRKK